jgi:hypothetical protein
MVLNRGGRGGWTPDKDIIVWKRPPRRASDLELNMVYQLLPDEESVYATLLDDQWYLVGKERSFSVADDDAGTVTESTEDVDPSCTLTLDNFDPTFRYMTYCSVHRVLNDWGHAEVCPD